MTIVDVPSDVAAHLEHLARVFHTSIADVLRNVLELPESNARQAKNLSAADSFEDVYMKCYGKEVEGRFNRQTEQLEVKGLPLSRKIFPNPSQAAREVVQHFNQNVNPSRNGWATWKLRDSNKPIQAIRLSKPRNL